MTTTTKQTGQTVMVAKIYDENNRLKARLRVSVSDLESLIGRCGWTVVDSIDGLTSEARNEIVRLESLPYIELPNMTTLEAIAWWNSRKIETAT